MVEINSNPFFIERYAVISEFADKVNRVSGGVFDYQTYKNKYSELISRKHQFEEWEAFLKKFFTSVISDACVYLIDFATKNKGPREIFNEEIKIINQIKKRVDVNNLRYEELVTLRIEIDDIGKVIEEKITFCKKDRFWKWAERIISYLLGIITTVVLYFILKKV